MKVWYLDRTSIQESYSDFGICATCSFNFLDFKCCQNILFSDLHPCSSVGKYYQEITKSDIFNL